MDKYLFFAVFSEHEKGGYTITFPDLKACITESDSIEEGIKKAKEALEIHLLEMENDNSKISKPTKPSDIKLKENEFVVPINCNMKTVREETLYGIAYRENDLRKYEHISYQYGRALFYDGVDFTTLVRNFLPMINSKSVDFEKMIFKIKNSAIRSFLFDLFLPGYSFDDNLDFQYMCFLGYTEAFNNVKEEYVCLELYCYDSNIDSYDILQKIIKNNSNDVDEIHDRIHFVKKDLLERYIDANDDNLKVIFIRHGKPDYECCDKSGFVAQGYNLAPLSKEGIKQAEKVSLENSLKNCDLIISSPYTRALQTAAIISKNTGININVETDLHEWLPDKKYEYKTNREFYSKYKDYIKNKGIYPKGEEKSWETTKEIQNRVVNVLKKYTNYKKIIVVCHEEVIKSILNIPKVKYCEIYDYEFN